MLTKRLQRIRSLTDDSKIILGIIGSYHDNNKGYDTIIKALEIIKNENISLHILGIGVKEDQDKWISYASQHNVHNIVFDKPPFIYKFVFTSDDYSLNSQIIFKEYQGKECVINDALHFRKYIDLTKWLNKESDFNRY